MPKATVAENRSSPPSVLILGIDAVLAARPASAVQLAHAALRGGYDFVVPATWGDELVAAELLRRLRERKSGPAIACACPLVANRLLRGGSDIAEFLVSLVPPPVAAARYLRASFGERRIRVAYVGRCPGGSDMSIDARFAPDEFLAMLADRGVRLSEQPTVFDSVLPPDRRRFHSLPGGVPVPEALWNEAGGRALVEIDGDLVTDLAHRLLTDENALLDPAPAVGCHCSGMMAGVAPRAARVAVAGVEPPRARAVVVDPDVAVDLSLPLPQSTRDPMDVLGGVSRPARANGDLTPAPVPRVAAEHSPEPEPEAPAGAPAGTRRRSPPGGVRPILGSLPTTRSGEGRVLPRAYVARRRSPPADRAGSIIDSPPRAHPRFLPGDADRERRIAAVVEPQTPASSPAVASDSPPLRAQPPAAPTPRTPVTAVQRAPALHEAWQRLMADERISQLLDDPLYFAVAVALLMLLSLTAGVLLVGAVG